MSSRPVTLLSDHKDDSVEKDLDFASPNKKLKVENDLGGDDNTHIPMSIDDSDPKVANDDLGGGGGDNTSSKPDDDMYTEAEARAKFKNWCGRTGNAYRTDEEKEYRFTVFWEELQSLGKPCGIGCGLNHYSDLTTEEKMSMLFTRCESDSTSDEDHWEDEHHPDVQSDDDDWEAAHPPAVQSDEDDWEENMG